MSTEEDVLNIPSFFQDLTLEPFRERTHTEEQQAYSRCADQAKYKYTPLRDAEIRLLELLPGAFDDDIQLRIVHQELPEPSEDVNAQQRSRKDVERELPKGWFAYLAPEGYWWYASTEDEVTYQHPRRLEHSTNLEASLESEVETEYEALSYAWGNPARERKAYIVSDNKPADKHPEGPVLYITENLRTALCYLRIGLDRPRTLWIDAVCIDQDNTFERETQIQRIPSIYKHARRVVVWLGPEEEGSQHAIDILDKLGRQIEISVDGWVFQAPGATHPKWWHSMCALPYSGQEWTWLQDFFKRAFFARLWVLQELFMANKNTIWQCGRATITWHRVRRAMAALSSTVGVPDVIQYAVQGKNVLIHGDKSRYMLTVTRLSRCHDCSDPHDKLYGVMAFLGPKLRQAIQPSYAKPYIQVCRELFLEYSNMTGRLDLLTDSSPDWGSFDRPSWVPDIGNFSYKGYSVGSGHQAAGVSPASFEVIEAHILAVKGRILGRVSSSHGTVADNDDKTIAKKLDRLLAKTKLDEPYVTGEDMLDVWARILVLNQTQERYAGTGYIPSADLKSALLYFLESNEEEGHNDRLSRLDQLDHKYRHVLAHMRFFFTDDGYVGFGPNSMRRGDVVCVLLGLWTPLVIRPTDDGHFMILGWCYVPGLMDVEALTGPLAHGWRAEMRNEYGRFGPRYKYLPVNGIQMGDPRLDPLPDEWYGVYKEATADDPAIVEFFRNSVTGEEINYDPRMTAESLEARGVKLDMIYFV